MPVSWRKPISLRLLDARASHDETEESNISWLNLLAFLFRKFVSRVQHVCNRSASGAVRQATMGLNAITDLVV